MRKILLASLMLILLPIVFSVGVSPPSVEYVFEAGQSGDLQFYFRNNLDKDTTLLANISGELAKYATITSESAILLKPGERRYVDVSFSLPDYIGEPGWHNFNIVATEAEGSGGTVGARGQVVVPVKFFVLYLGKKLSIKMDAYDAGAGEDVKFKLYVTNIGTEPVQKASAVIEILKDRQKIGQVSTQEFSMDVMENKVIDASWNSGSYGMGVYLANANLSYDNIGNAFANDTFRIGTFDVNVLNFTRIAGIGTINKFFIEIESRWNQEIENIFADVKVLQGGNALASFSLAAQSLGPWETKNLTGYLDGTGIPNGIYNLEMEITFSSGGVTKSKIVNGTVEFIEKSAVEESNKIEKGSMNLKKGLSSYLTTVNILVALVVILIIVNIIMLIRKKRKNEESQI